jgi:UDP-N-acetylglucosamine:LPS N-acetylglucosamine transferase
LIFHLPWIVYGKQKKEFNPDVVIGTGGFASGPLLWPA